MHVHLALKGLNTDLLTLPHTQRKRGTKTVPLGHHFGNGCLFRQQGHYFGAHHQNKVVFYGLEIVPQRHCFVATYFIECTGTNLKSVTFFRVKVSVCGSIHMERLPSAQH